jgi:stress response protein YsnF
MPRKRDIQAAEVSGLGCGVKTAIPEERTVEVHETEEVPVVGKTARVIEEVAIRKEATERTETVKDTVRREEVEVTGNDVPSSQSPRP